MARGDRFQNGLILGHIHPPIHWRIVDQAPLTHLAITVTLIVIMTWLRKSI
jgi:hypothetical protein